MDKKTIIHLTQKEFDELMNKSRQEGYNDGYDNGYKDRENEIYG